MLSFPDYMYSIEWWTIVLYTTDGLFFFLYAFAVLYLLFFAIASTYKRKKRYEQINKQYRYAVLLFCEQNHIQDLNDSIHSFCMQNYKRENFDLYIISNKPISFEKDSSNSGEAKIISSNAPLYNKAELARYAMSILTEENYDSVIIMDGNDCVGPNFINDINNAAAAGNIAIQTHRVTRNRDTDTAIFGAVSEEINNSIYRKGHINIGFSSALIGSRMVFNYDWLKSNIINMTKADLEKQLEKRLLEQYIYTEYLEQATVLTNKASNASEFYKQRHSWLTNRIETIKEMVLKFPVALLQGNYDYCNKLIQWLIPSRTILTGTIPLIITLLLFLSWGMAIKWGIIFLLLIIAFSIALPDSYIDARFIVALRRVPLLFVITAYDILKHRIIHK